jgi:hypothetical protein
MKKTIVLISCLCLLALTVSAQKLSKREAKQLLNKAITCLKNNDEAGFTNLWLLDNTAWTYHERPFAEKDVKAHFDELKLFLDTALTQNLKIADIDIEKWDKEEGKKYASIYNIKVWFKYNKSYQKGMGFNVDYVNGKWVCRFAPDYSTMLANIN